MYQNGSEVNIRRWLVVVSLGSFTSSCHWLYETARPNQNSVFQKCEPVVYAGLGFWNDDDYGTLTKLHGLVWVHQAWHHAMHIEKVLSLTQYETLMTLIGYWIIANQLCYEGMGYQYCMFGHHTQCEPERLYSSIYSTSVSLHYCDIPSQVADDVSSILRMISFTCPLALPRLINPELLESQSIINARLCYEQDYSQLLYNTGYHTEGCLQRV